MTKEKLRRVFTKATEKKINSFYEVFSNYSKLFKIETTVQENFFLAQIVAETGYALKGRRENLNYTPKSLRSTFKRYRKNPKWSERDGRTKSHAANQKNIGDIAYANRIGNGDIFSGDGYRFRGGGYFQLTGRSNYSRMAKVISNTIQEDISPEDVANKITKVKMGILTAMAFWLDNKCYTCDHIDCVTKKINRYTKTYEKRKDIYLKIALNS